MKISIPLAATLVASTLIARADERHDFALDIKDYTGDYYKQFIMEKLTTFKLGAKCWKKMHDKNENGQHSASFWVGYVADYAKKAGAGDFSAVESQNNNDREKNKPLVEKMVNDFAGKFSFTLTNDGDDCDTTMGSLMLRYWGTVGNALQYLSGKNKVNITLNVTAKTKDIETKVSGNNITITASRDIEPGEWDQKIEKAIKRSNL
ncbi:MAG TPA: hypothetical protein VGO00_17720 [Kofleriaceae bacterium]|jgi:hypothetical protein|nr:hypothetical protein [Kofleriaceae bacterium]